MDGSEKVNQVGETVGQAWEVREQLWGMAPLHRMAAEAELLIGNLLYREAGPEAAELYRAALEARMTQGVDAEVRRAMRSGMAVSKTVLRGLKNRRRRMARAMKRFALRGGE